MTIPSRFPGSILVTALLLFACSDDDNPTNGTTDTKPPGLTAVTPIDLYHVEVTFDEPLDRSSVEQEGHFTVVEAATPARAAAAPGDPLFIRAATLKLDERTVSVNTGSSMAGVSCELVIEGVSDKHGNTIAVPVHHTFTGSSASDETPPEILSRTPGVNATNAPQGTPVTIVFSESIGGLVATWTSPGGPISYDFSGSGSTIILSPEEPLALNSLQTITLVDIHDQSGNFMADTEWSFRITNVADVTPPSLVSSSPANLATNVSVDAHISLTFSERIRPDASFWITPEITFQDIVFSTDGKTVRLVPEYPLDDNQQYVVTIEPYDVADLAGNWYGKFTSVTFSTGALESGSIAGTIAGHSGTAAADPTGAAILAEGYEAYLTTSVAANDTYRVSQLPDDIYALIVVKDTNGEPGYDIFSGDAIGAYGVDFATYDLELDTVIVYGGSDVTGIDFPIFDPSAIGGYLTYSGQYTTGVAYVGLFDVETFDPDYLAPLVTWEAWSPDYTWVFNSLMDEFPDGDYYVGAIMDGDENGYYDPGIDPLGFYGGADSPAVIHVANGSDRLDIAFMLEDPPLAARSGGQRVALRTSTRHEMFSHLGDIVRQRLPRSSR